ncbi:MAG: N-acetyltransferase [Alphaproteobacteria bacterium]|nr:N-acetyltransferase [Alphaproteobacteria bacterium]
MRQITLTQETREHQSARNALITACFADPQPGRAAFKLREDVAPIDKFSYVALDGATVIGSLRFYPLRLPNDAEVLMLGPLAIAPLLRGHRIGQRLVQHGVDMLKSTSYNGLIVIGDAGYFTALDFDVALTQHLKLPGIVAPLTLLGLEWHVEFLSQQSGMLRRIA